MINLKVLGAVVVAASALCSSAVLAQAALSNPDECQADFANCTGLGTGTTPTAGYRYRQSTRRTASRQPTAAGATVGSWGNSYAMSGEMGWHGN
ncbi:opacity protein-like surface antigen [Bradyrhizobium sp. S3.2.12]